MGRECPASCDTDLNPQKNSVPKAPVRLPAIVTGGSDLAISLQFPLMDPFVRW
jgi:hypothetical protein